MFSRPYMRYTRLDVPAVSGVCHVFITAKPAGISAPKSVQRLAFQTEEEHELTCSSSYFHLLAIKLLNAFTGLSFLEFGDGKTARVLSQSHSEGVISSLWHFYTTFGMRHDSWLLHSCHAAVATLLVNNTLPGIHEESLSRGCQLLYHMGQYMPRANGLILAIWNEAQDRDIKWPAVGKRFLRASLVNVQRTTVLNASHLRLSEGSIGEPLLHSHRVSFRKTLESIEMLEKPRASLPPGET